MSRSTTLNALFLIAGCTSAIASEALYRVALVVIVLLLRAWWARAAIRRSRDEVIGEINRRRARANRKANPSESVQYQGESPLRRESLLG
jgi:hypothetical protein